MAGLHADARASHKSDLIPLKAPAVWFDFLVRAVCIDVEDLGSRHVSVGDGMRRQLDSWTVGGHLGLAGPARSGGGCRCRCRSFAGTLRCLLSHCLARSLHSARRTPAKLMAFLGPSLKASCCAPGRPSLLLLFVALKSPIGWRAEERKPLLEVARLNMRRHLVKTGLERSQC